MPILASSSSRRTGLAAKLTSESRLALLECSGEVCAIIDAERACRTRPLAICPTMNINFSAEPGSDARHNFGATAFIPSRASVAHLKTRQDTVNTAKTATRVSIHVRKFSVRNSCLG